MSGGRHPNDATVTEVLVGDILFVPCPPDLLELAGQCADLDARAIVRALWPHILEASLAGIEPFSLGAAS